MASGVSCVCFQVNVSCMCLSVLSKLSCMSCVIRNFMSVVCILVSGNCHGQSHRAALVVSLGAEVGKAGLEKNFHKFYTSFYCPRAETCGSLAAVCVFAV